LGETETFVYVCASSFGTLLGFRAILGYGCRSQEEVDVQPGRQSRETLGTVRHAAQLFQLLSEGPAHHQLTDLAERSGMSLPTVHRLLRSLTEAGLVEQDPRSLRYGLGPELVLLAERYLERLPVLHALSPYLVELRNVTKATVLVALLIGRSVVYADRIDGDGGRFHEAHRCHAALETAAGRVLLANAPQSVWEEATGSCPEGRVHTERDREAWARSAYVLTGWEVPDTVEIAVPVRDQSGCVLAALSATADPHVFPEDFAGVVGPPLLRVARLAGRTLGNG
jgi:IclR family transcriptional regulator, acetate operon repressor